MRVYSLSLNREVAIRASEVMIVGVHRKKIKRSMKKILTIIGLLLTGFVYGQETETANFVTEIAKYDISDLWTLTKFRIEFENDTSWIERMEPLGYIGEHYQRFYIHFSSVIPNPVDRLQYFVYGKTRVKTNICAFQGLIKIKEAKTYYDKELPSIKQGFITGDYEFYEDPNQKGTGILKGKFRTNFYIDKNRLITYNSLLFVADGFENNQFEGIWASYKSKESKKCNWGDYRIPDSERLDHGGSEFNPADEYLKYDWENYKDLFSGSNEDKKVIEARKGGQIKWWIDKE